jgi:hypothetical protein
LLTNAKQLASFSSFSLSLSLTLSLSFLSGYARASRKMPLDLSEPMPTGAEAQREHLEQYLREFDVEGQQQAL